MAPERTAKKKWIQLHKCKKQQQKSSLDLLKGLLK